MWTAILAWFQTKVLTIVAVLGAGFSLFSVIRKSGRSAERVDQLEKTLENVRTKNEIAKNVERLPSGAAADRLRDKWSRD